MESAQAAIPQTGQFIPFGGHFSGRALSYPHKHTHVHAHPHTFARINTHTQFYSYPLSVGKACDKYSTLKKLGGRLCVCQNLENSRLLHFSGQVLGHIAVVQGQDIYN